MQPDIATPFPRSLTEAPAGSHVVRSIRRAIDRPDAAQIGLFFVTLALGIYVFSHPSRSGLYDHFVWQADAFLQGRFVIAWPVLDGPFINGEFQDVMPQPSGPSRPSYGLLPFPPLPAVVLMPFVAIFGLATDAQLVGAVIGALNVGLAWRMAARLTDSRGAAFLATLFFAFGTVHWYAAMLSTTWFLAHVVATTFVLLAITLALDAERRYALRRRATDDVSATLEEYRPSRRWYQRARELIDPVQFMAGFVFGLGALARLPVIFAAPFFMFVGGGGSYTRRALAAGLGAALPLGLLLVYNLAATGHVFNPAYEYLYRTEFVGYLPPQPCPFTPDFCAGLRIDRSLGIEDVRHVPLNALIMLGWPPIVRPECDLSTLLDPQCPLLRPDAIGMSILLTSPAYLLALPMAIAGWTKRIVVGSVLAIGAIAFINLMHFSQGWVQFGYRFSNDFAPFALILVSLAIARLGRSRVALALVTALVAASIIINAWGVYWGVTLAW